MWLLFLSICVCLYFQGFHCGWSTSGHMVADCWAHFPNLYLWGGMLCWRDMPCWWRLRMWYCNRFPMLWIFTLKGRIAASRFWSCDNHGDVRWQKRAIGFKVWSGNYFISRCIVSSMYPDSPYCSFPGWATVVISILLFIVLFCHALLMQINAVVFLVTLKCPQRWNEI